MERNAESLETVHTHTHTHTHGYIKLINRLTNVSLNLVRNKILEYKRRLSRYRKSIYA